MKKSHMLLLLVLISSPAWSQAGPNNFYENEGGRLSHLQVDASDDGLTLTCDDGEELMTLVLGDLPAEGTSKAYQVIAPDGWAPESGEVSLAVHYYGGNEEEDLTYTGSDETAKVTVKKGKVTVAFNHLTYEYPEEGTGSTATGSFTSP